MSRLSAVWALARAELRSILRLVRFWVFAVLATGLALISYLYYAVIHGLFSSFSGSVGAVSPKFLIAQAAIWLTVIFVIGIVFLAFDVRARDRRDRIVEVLDTRPYSNLELVLGRFLGTLLAVWIPVLLVIFLIQSIGLLGEAFGWYIGEVVVWGSVFHFLLLDALPAFAFYIAFVYFVSLLVGNRLVSAVAGLAVLGMTMWLSFTLPIYSLPALGLNGGYTGSASEVSPDLFGIESFVLRGALLMTAAGLLTLAAAVHPRLDGGQRKLWAAGGVFLVAFAVAIVGGSVLRARAGVEQQDAWRQAHEARVGEPVVDLERIAGRVAIRPGRDLELDLELAISAPLASSMSTALFSFNPGLKITSIRGSGGELQFSHHDGLLEIELARLLAAGEKIGLRLEASGAPDLRFAYLDSAIRFENVSGQQAQIVILGTEAGFFDRRFVALMPTLAWLPKAGPQVALDDPRKRSADFFDLDLEVSAPRGWRIAGPGRGGGRGGGSDDVSEGETAHLRPVAQVPEVALIAGRFERRSREIEGVEIELLFDPDHLRNLDFFTDALPEIERRVSELFTGAREIGLAYPYDVLSLVEVPWTLRNYGGGWRMDTVQAPPGLLLLSESAFPTTRFEFPFRNPDRFEEQEGGISRAKLETLERFFENDFSGGNILDGAVRNLFLYQTAAHGPEALALQVLCHDLANRLVTGRRAYFSAYVFDASLGWVVAETVPVVASGLASGRAAGDSIASAVIRATTDRPEVWDGALHWSLTEMDPWEDPERAVNVLALKGSAIATSILDSAGRQKAGEMLAALLRDHRGSTFGADDLMVAAEEVGIDLDALLGDFLHQTALPGFVVSAARLDRLPDDDQGLPQYQTRLFVRNAEPVPGLLRLRYTTGQDERRPTWESSEPVRLAGNSSIELGLVTSKPPQRLLLSPYLSLNRRDFPVTLPKVDEEKTVEMEPLRGARPADWMPSFAGQIVVDDLDEGFRVEEGEESAGLRLVGGIRGAFRPPEEFDQGLPYLRFGPPPDTWSRTEIETTWGRYRRTVAVVAAGDGSRTATFGAELPQAGRWRIELHLPERPSGPEAAFNQGWRFGSYDLELRQGSEQRAIEFDAAAAEGGWSSLGDFDLDRGSVEVVLSDETSGSLVLADALRFVRLDGAGVGGGL